MADLRVPISHEVLQLMAQDMLNSRNQPHKVKGGIIGVLKHSKQCFLRTSLQELPIVNPATYKIGINWLSRFLSRNLEFGKKYV